VFANPSTCLSVAGSRRVHFKGRGGQGFAATTLPSRSITLNQLHYQAWLCVHKRRFVLECLFIERYNVSPDVGLPRALALPEKILDGVNIRPIKTIRPKTIPIIDAHGVNDFGALVVVLSPFFNVRLPLFCLFDVFVRLLYLRL
jgi:hypothetical protein